MDRLHQRRFVIGGNHQQGVDLQSEYGKTQKPLVQDGCGRNLEVGGDRYGGQTGRDFPMSA